MVSRSSTRWRRALVTGASAGIGECFARTLAARGTDLVLVARREERLRSLAGELSAQHGVEAEVEVADLVERMGIRAVEERLEADDRPIDLLVNNAGGSAGNGRGAFTDVDREILEGQVMLNAVAVVLLTHAAATAMKRRGGGRIIQVSAGTAFYPIPHGAVYGASKSLVNNLSEAIDFELKESGVGITVVCPGFTRTDAPARIGFTERNIPRLLWSDPEEVVGSALDAAARDRVLTSPALVNKVNARLGRHFPRAMMRRAARITRGRG